MKVLFVCLGNICRSPTGEAVFRKMVSDAGLQDDIEIDSCGTSSRHTGEDADVRMQTHAELRGYKLTSKARGLVADDLKIYDYILAMDNSNFDNIVKLDKDKAYTRKVHKMISFCTRLETPDVPDPYYGGPDGFEEVLDILEDSCKGLLTQIQKEIFEATSQRI